MSLRYSKGTTLLRSVGMLTEKHIIGVGTEKNVYQHPEHPTRLIKKYTWAGVTSGRLKSDFYLSTILNLLYPNKFPKIYFCLPSSKILVVEKIKSNIILSFFAPLFSLKTRYLAFKSGVSLDTAGPENFILDYKFNAKYVDTPICIKENALEKMIIKKLRAEDQEKALRYLKEYKKIYAKHHL